MRNAIVSSRCARLPPAYAVGEPGWDPARSSLLHKCHDPFGDASDSARPHIIVR